MSSFSFAGCTASWSGQELELSNALFSRKWAWRDGQLAPLALEVEGYAWPGRGDEERPVLAPMGPGQAAFEGEPVLAMLDGEDAVGEYGLRVSLTAGSTVYEFRVWEHLPGYAARVTFERALAEGLTTVAEGSTGVEVDQPVAEIKAESDVLEAFRLPVNAHFRLLAPEFFDQTDVHAELVQNREYLVHPCEWDLKLRGNVFLLEDVLTGRGLAMVKHAPLPGSRTLRGDVDGHLSRGSNFTVHGHGTRSGTGDWWGVFAYVGGEAERITALHRYQRLWRRYEPWRDGKMLSNTWGDRGRDAHLSPEFMMREVEAAARLGVDVVQIDDGWQHGTTANSAEAKAKGGVWNGFWASDDRFWDVNETRFPDGLGKLVDAASENGMQFGLWFAPDSSKENVNWERDADAILKLRHDLGINFFKIDALKLETRLGEERARLFLERVRTETRGRVTFDLDITAEDRFGPFGLIEAGPLFVENRYTDWHRYWPHHTLRVGWQLAHWIDPVRLRMEWLNVERHADKYEGDSLAPVKWRPDAVFATVIPFAPLAWFEVQNLPAKYFEAAAPLVRTWKRYRENLQRCTMLPIGNAPDGVSWTGFFWRSEREEFALVFRELNASSTFQIQIPGSEAYGPGEVLGGRGTAALKKGLLEVEIGEELGFVWVRWEI